MKRATGMGGVFVKCDDAEAQKKWYERHLGIPMDDYGAQFEWREKETPEKVGQTVFGFFKKDTTYFDPSKKDYMLNFRVENLDETLKALRSEGVTVDDKVEDYDYGKFAWIMDPEGNRVELWEPKDIDPPKKG
jgi:lactoylglutathione lyase